MKSFLIIAILFTSTYFFAQKNHVDNQFFLKNKKTEKAFIDSLSAHGSNTSHNISFIQQKPKFDKSGNSHTRYKQLFDGFTINNATIILHSRNKEIIKKNGQHYSINTDVPNHQFDQNVAIDLAKEKFAFYLMEKLSIANPIAAISVEKIEKTYSDRYYPKFTNTIIPTYNITISHNTYEIKHLIILDATTGIVLHTNEIIKHVQIPGKGISNYYSAVDINLDSLAPNKILFKDLTKGANIIINDYNTNRVVEVKKSNIDLQDPWKNAAVDVLYGTSKFYDFMLEKFNFRSLDDNDYPLVANIGRTLYNNAFWNGENTNYGNGDCYNYSPFTSIDIVGHEFAHGITDFNSELIYQGESGALNESFSDIIGKALEKWAQSDQFSWVLGQPIFRAARPFRTMNAPHLHDHPSVYKGINWEDRVFFSLGVHTNSAVSNLWFYVLSEGKKGKNELGINYDVKPIGMDKALDIVFHTHINYLNPSSGYADMYYFSLEATQDIYPNDEAILNSVKEAWKAVGITPKILESEENVDPLSLNINELRNGSPLCDKKVADITINLNYNAPDTIPANTPINTIIYTVATRIINGKITNVTDTILREVYLSNLPIFKGSQLSFSLKNPIDTDSLIFGMNFHGIINFQLQNVILKYQTPYFTLNIINTKREPADIFRKGTQKTAIPKDKCDPSLGFEFLTYEILSFLCDTSSIPFKLYIKNDDTAKDFIVYGDGPSGSFSQIFLRNLNQFLIDSDIKNIENSILEIYSIVDNKEYLEISDTLNQYFAKHLKPNEKITFDNQLMPSSMNVTKCSDCDQKIVNGLLEIKTIYNTGILDDCVDLDTYFDIKKQSRFNLSTVQICVDLDKNENQVLHFDTYLQDLYPYNNIVKVRDHEGYFNNFIITETDGLSSFSIPLEKSGKFGITFEGLLFNSLWKLDNIRIEGKSNTEVFSQHEKSFISNNPADDILWISITDDKLFSQLNFSKVTGEFFYSKILTDVNHPIQIKEWPSGIYFASLINKNQIQTKKIIIQH